MQASELPRSTSTPAVRFSAKAATRLSRDSLGQQGHQHPFDQVLTAPLQRLPRLLTDSVAVPALPLHVHRHLLERQLQRGTHGATAVPDARPALTRPATCRTGPWQTGGTMTLQTASS